MILKPSNFPDSCWLFIINWTPRNNYKWNLNWKTCNLNSWKNHLKIVSANCWPFCSGLTVIRIWPDTHIGNGPSFKKKLISLPMGLDRSWNNGMCCMSFYILMVSYNCVSKFICLNSLFFQVCLIGSYFLVKMRPSRLGMLQTGRFHIAFILLKS